MAEDMVEAVRRAFRQEPRLGPGFDVTHIVVESDGVLTLEGEVASLAQKKLALLKAASVPGSMGIADNLRVVAAPTNDRELRARLREMFATDADFCDVDVREDVEPGVLRTDYRPVSGAGGAARGRIDIEVDEGVVTLNGFVPTLVRKRLAGVMAWGIAGVRDVINGLAVHPNEEDGPDQIEEAVRVVLERDRSLDAAQVKVGVRGRVVRLTGLVHAQAARQAAEEDAWAVFGVNDVVNEIAVRP
jgi:osmotically-inducible protein OsmY